MSCAAERHGDDGAEREDCEDSENEEEQAEARDRGSAPPDLGVEAVEREADVDASDVPAVVRDGRPHLVNAIVGREPALCARLRRAGRDPLENAGRHRDLLVRAALGEVAVERGHGAAGLVEDERVDEIGVLADGRERFLDAGAVFEVQGRAGVEGRHLGERMSLLHDIRDRLAPQPRGHVDEDHQGNDAEKAAHDGDELRPHGPA